MPDRHVDHLLIGGGVASASCARALREEGATGSIMLVGRELDPPYRRPPATKAYLLGQLAREDLHVLPQQWYAEAGVELRTRTAVMALDADARTAKLAGGEVVAYGSALLATGAMVRRLQLDGMQLEGIHYIRAAGNADALRADLGAAERVVCVGGSYIGCEVAASVRALGTPCTIVMQEREPMARGFGELVGGVVAQHMREHGVEIVAQAEVARLEGTEGGRVSGVRLADGRLLAADVVVCGTGAVPDTTLARRAGVAIGERGGVRCDATLASLSHSGLYAAGDVCEHDSPLSGSPLRLEHEAVAEAHGVTVARNMLGQRVEHTEPPSFWTELGDWLRLDLVGLTDGCEQQELDGDAHAGTFSVRYLREGSVRAVVSARGVVSGVSSER
ncbi:MAG TPA: FAD-dependent oxidoreductase [Conexibacter sp.]